jgi:ABC-type antimicrobial peptide transport system permease subunit
VTGVQTCALPISLRKNTPLAQVTEQSPNVEPVQTEPTSTPPQSVDTPVTEPQPSKPVQKGGRKSKTVVQVSEPIVQTSEPVVAKSTNKKRGSKTKVASTPVITETTPTGLVASTETTPIDTKKRIKKATPNSEVVNQTGVKLKISKVKKAEKKPVVENEVEGDAEGDETSGKHVRSFKVKLPNKEEFEGRFTGLTPYQAANKALSKYFRETEQPKEEITFLICESTRKSKKSVYTYIGKRYKLDEPVRYKIQDGREIVKNFKNSLKKVKKVDLIDQSGGKLGPIITSTPVTSSVPVVTTA